MLHDCLHVTTCEIISYFDDHLGGIFNASRIGKDPESASLPHELSTGFRKPGAIHRLGTNTAAWTTPPMADGDHGPRAQFHSMEHCTKDDWRIINRAMKPFIAELPDRVLAHLRMLHGDCGGFAVDRLDHCLQTATRAYKDGRDEEYVVCALLHDLGDLLGPRNHADIAAAILKPLQWLLGRSFRGKRDALLLVSGGDRTAAALLLGGCDEDRLIRTLDCGIPDALVDRPRVSHAGVNRSFVHLGRLVPYKGCDLAIRALARGDAGATLDIIGDGPSRGDLTALAERLGLGERVRFIGWMPTGPALHGPLGRSEHLRHLFDRRNSEHPITRTAAAGEGTAAPGSPSVESSSAASSSTGSNSTGDDS